MKLSVPEYIESIDPYKPGKPLEELEREYGIRDSIKLASNENPLGPSPKAIEAIRAGMESLHTTRTAKAMNWLHRYRKN